MEKYCRHERHNPNVGPIIHQQHIKEKTWQAECNSNQIIRRKIFSPFKWNTITQSYTEK